jgi:RimJ/RimL family protein N-acetyltransferase
VRIFAGQLAAPRARHAGAWLLIRLENMEIELKTCLIRPWRPGDEESLVAHANNHNVWRNMRDRFPHPYTTDDAREWIRRIGEESPLTNFAIVVDGEAAGGIGLVLNGDIHRCSAEIGYWLGETFWGRGVMTEAVRALTQWAFDNFNLSRIYAGVLEWNPASMRVLEKAGYQFEGRLRKAVVKQNRVMDEFIYSVVIDKEARTVMSENLARHYLENVIAEFRSLKKLGDRAMEQLDDEQFFVTLDPESNSVAIIVKHLAGNMRSRWVDFLTSDGEKTDRHRDQEFIIDASAKRAEVVELWERGWRHVFDAVEPLRPDDVMRTVTIRQEPHTVLQAINRQLGHYAAHVGQIVFLAKHLKSAEWKTLSVPRGQSEQLNRMMTERLQNQTR